MKSKILKKFDALSDQSDLFIPFLGRRLGIQVITRSLSYRILKRGIYSVVLVIIFSSISMYLLELHSGRAALSAKSEQILYRISNTFAMPFWSLDDRMVNTLIRIELLDPEVIAVSLRHENGDLYTGLYEDGSDKILPFAEGTTDAVLKKSAVMRSADMVMSGRVFGHAEVYFSDAHFKRGMFFRMLYISLLVVVVTIATFFITHRSIRRKVILPIEMMSKVVERFRNKDFSVRTEVLSDDELGVLSVNINEMADRIQQYNQSLEDMVAERTIQLVNAEKMAALGELVAGISHEINTPVGTAITAASFLEHTTHDFTAAFQNGKTTDADLRDFLKISFEALSLTMSNLGRASELVQSFKKIASDRSSAEMRKFKLREYINDVVTSLRPRLKRTSHQVMIECDDDLEIFSYPGEISQILTNFIMNSLVHGFHSDAGGIMRIDARIADGLIILVYSDNGDGIPEDHLSKIFNPFFTTKRGSGGSGLGLNIVYNIVTQTLGGSIECGSQIGIGTTFTVIFPDGKAE